MADTKFTAGPWEAVNRDTCQFIYAKGYERAICQVDSYSKGFGPDRDERDANAHLMAAAPELYEAAERLIKAGTDAFNAMSHYAEVNNTTSAVSHNLSNALDYGIFHLAKARGEAA